MRKIVLILLGTILLLGQASQPDMRKQKVGLINRAVARGDKESLSVAVEEINSLFDERIVPSVAMNSWIRPLLEKGQYDDVALLTVRISLLVPDSRTIGTAMQIRSEALLRAGKATQALEAAKIAYMVGPLSSSHASAALLTKCFLAASPDKRDDIVKLNKVLTSADGATEKDTVIDLYKSVKVDRSVFIKEIEHLGATRHTFGEKLNYGNLLLASEDYEKAEATFRELYESTDVDPRQKDQASEAIARTLRARDGCEVQSTRWLRLVQNGTASTRPTELPR